MDYIQEFIYEVKRLSALITFDCDFKDGTCKSRRKRPLVMSTGRVSKSCCDGCAACKGYGALNDDNKAMFDDKLGFQDKVKGCVLPRHRRSMVCLMFSCRMGSKAIEIRPLLNLMRDLVREHGGRAFIDGIKGWPKDLDTSCIGKKTKLRLQYLRRKATAQEKFGGQSWRGI